MINIKLSNEDYNNIVVFLDRVSCQGLKEIQAMSLILQALNEGKENANIEGREK